jgi:predicted nucleotidyltransferase
MIAVTEQIIQDMVRAIVAEVSPERIILFGSRARRGQAG